MLTRFPERAHLTSKWALISAYGAMEGGEGIWEGHMARTQAKGRGQGHGQGKVRGKDSGQ